jgi:hypothetical protein
MSICHIRKGKQEYFIKRASENTEALTPPETLMSFANATTKYENHEPGRFSEETMLIK